MANNTKKEAEVVVPEVPMDVPSAPALENVPEMSDEEKVTIDAQVAALAPTPASTPEPTPAASIGGEIAAAIAQGLKDSKRDKTIKITSDKSVISRFSVVRSKLTGEIMLRENGTGVLSKVQLQSIEEKEASIQGQEVEEV